MKSNEEYLNHYGGFPKHTSKPVDDDSQALLAWLGERQPMTPPKRRRFFIDRSDGFRFWSRRVRFGHSAQLNDWWISIGRKGRYHIYYRKVNNGTPS